MSSDFISQVDAITMRDYGFSTVSWDRSRSCPDGVEPLARYSNRPKDPYNHYFSLGDAEWSQEPDAIKALGAEAVAEALGNVVKHLKNETDLGKRCQVTHVAYNEAFSPSRLSPDIVQLHYVTAYIRGIETPSSSP